jgi:hypothetical protein
VKLQPGKLQARKIAGPKIADQAHLDRGSGRMSYLKLQSRRNLSSCDSALTTGYCRVEFRGILLLRAKSVESLRPGKVSYANCACTQRLK